nr:transport and Golgi organization protein 1 homolog isoform X3 [Oryctolagus cuniculus]
MKVWRWIFWFPVLGLPSHTAQNPSQNFPGHFQLSTDFWGIFRKLIIIATVVTISAFAIFFWTTMLVLKLPIYQVNSQQISEKINNAIKENAELMQKISVLEQKITESKKCLLETNRQKEMVSDEPMKLKAFEKGKSENLKEVISMNSGISELLKLEDENDGVKDLQLRALRAKIWMLEESKKNLEKSCNTLKSVKAAKEAEIKLMDMNMESFHEIYKLKVAAAAKRRLQEIQAQQQQEKETFRQEIAVHKKKTHDIELRAQALERELMVQKRETAHLKHRLEIMQAEESRRQKPVSGGPGWENPPQRDSTTCAGYMKNQGSSPAEDTRKEQVNMATGGPPPFPRPPYMPYHMGGYRESFMGYPPPPPPWWIPRPQPAPLSPEFGEPLWNWNRKLSYPEQAVPVGQKAT